MRLSFLLLIPVLLGSVLAAGCTSDNPAYCEDDSACTSADAPICHPAKHYCHVRCVTDKDCTDPSHPAFDPPKRVCHVASGHCVGAHDAGPRDAAVEGPSDGPASDASKLANGSACTSGAACTSSFCVDGVCCANACDGACVACNLKGSEGSCAPVPSGEACSGAHASCAGSCDGKGLCSFAAVVGKSCEPSTCASGELTSASCDANGSCVTKKQGCGGYACDGSACKTSCTSTATDCLGGAQCVGGKCVASLPLGSACGTNNDACASKLCTDGVCCKVASCGPCKTCGAGGECVPVPDSTSCGPAVCSATPGYKEIPTCKAGVCSSNPSQCAGSFICSSGSCLTVCTADAQCVASAYCSGGSCLPRASKGQSCTATGQCVAGLQCVDGVCCDSACAGKCSSCKVAGKLGTCSPIPPGLDPDNECVGDPGCASGCNGSGACSYATVGTSCKSPSCVSPNLTTFACNGTGGCVASTKACTPYQCDASGTACRSACTVSAHCLAGSFCTMGKCMTFTSIPTGTSHTLRALWGVSPTNIWAVGDSGTIARWNGVSWSTVASPTSGYLTGIWGAADNDIWAVAKESSNQILRYDGTSWKVFASPADVPLRAVWGAGSSSVWAAGDGGSIYHFDGTAWAKVASPTTETVYDVRGLSLSDAWAVGNNNTVLRNTGSGWGAAPGCTGGFKGVVPLTATDVWVGGSTSEAIVYHFNGTAWAQVGTLGWGNVEDLLPVSAVDVLAVGAFLSGSAKHWEGSGWVTVDAPGLQGGFAVRLIGGELWVVGAGPGGGHSVRAK